MNDWGITAAAGWGEKIRRSECNGPDATGRRGRCGQLACKPKGSLFAEGFEGARRDVIDRTQARDLAILGSLGVACGSPLTIVVHQRAGLLVVHVQTLANGVFLVVV